MESVSSGVRCKHIMGMWDGYHEGATKTDNVDKKELGGKAMFREFIDIGYRFFKCHAIMLHLEYISNAKLRGKNEGMENFGLRYGYKF